HYITVKDHQEKTQRLKDYAELLSQKVDAVTAAARAFGDLKQLQTNLDNYILQGSFSYFKLATSTGVDDAAFKVRALTEAQADAVRADFLACDDRAADARPLLDRVLREDPQNVSAHETMGFLELRAGHPDEARRWYEKAVKLDSQSYIAHYYFAAISMNDSVNPANDAQLESSLRAAIKLNPSFAPPFERLAAFEGMRRQNLDEAHMMVLNAVQLDPGNVAYRMTAANVLIEMQRSKDALAVLREALRIAKSPADTAMVQNLLTQVEQYSAAQQQVVEQNQRLAEEVKADAAAETAAGESNAEAEAQQEELQKGPHHFLAGTLQNVQCHSAGIFLTLVGKNKTMTLHSGNYYKIQFTALGFTPKDDLDPCKDLEGKSAKVEYVESSAGPETAYIIAVELHK
ncbi:MAG: tetratricopeptide repeat protein, partial [Terriglobales bacterium]